jgi:hypothetical protein
VARRTLVIIVLLLALAGTAEAQAAPLISLHGDSIAAQASTNLRNRLQRIHPVRLDATERAVIADKLPSIRVVGQNGRVVAEVLVLGAGDANNWHTDARMRREIRQSLDALRGVPCVRWLSLKIAGVNGYYQGYVQRADDFNRILAHEIADYPNARVAPYRQWANAHPGAFRSDGLHHTARGKTQFAAWVQQVVANCPGV